jgi:hypothetical protein
LPKGSARPSEEANEKQQNRRKCKKHGEVCPLDAAVGPNRQANDAENERDESRDFPRHAMHPIEVDIEPKRSFLTFFRSTIFQPAGKTYVSHRNAGRTAATAGALAGFLFLFRTKEIRKNYRSLCAEQMNIHRFGSRFAPT